jgi:hypothetical protein
MGLFPFAFGTLHLGRAGLVYLNGRQPLPKNLTVS